MFSNLVGFIKPLLRKDSTTTKTISRTRSVGEDEVPERSFKDYEDTVDLSDDNPEHESNTPHPVTRDDKTELSLEAVRMLIEESDESPALQQRALAHVKDLKKAGHTTVSFRAGESVVHQLAEYKL